jgi:hypothetical protein
MCFAYSETSHGDEVGNRPKGIMLETKVIVFRELERNQEVADEPEYDSPGPFRHYERLVPIKILGKEFHVPERNSLLRCFQFISPETIPYGRFCWNQDCQYCRVECKLPDEGETHELLSCKFMVMPGMEITKVSPELKGCLRAVMSNKK